MLLFQKDLRIADATVPETRTYNWCYSSIGLWYSSFIPIIDQFELLTQFSDYCPLVLSFTVPVFSRKINFDYNPYL